MGRLATLGRGISGDSTSAKHRRGADRCKRPAVRTPVNRGSVGRWAVRRLSVPMSVDFDGQAKDANAAHQDDIFDPCCAILESQQPFNAIQKFHDPTS
jgi:hypothetical protein